MTTGTERNEQGSSHLEGIAELESAERLTSGLTVYFTEASGKVITDLADHIASYIAPVRVDDLVGETYTDLNSSVLVSIRPYFLELRTSKKDPKKVKEVARDLVGILENYSIPNMFHRSGQLQLESFSLRMLSVLPFQNVDLVSTMNSTLGNPDFLGERTPPKGGQSLKVWWGDTDGKSQFETEIGNYRGTSDRLYVLTEMSCREAQLTRSKLDRVWPIFDHTVRQAIGWANQIAWVAVGKTSRK